MVTERDLLRAAADYAADFLESLGDRPIRAEADVEGAVFMTADVRKPADAEKVIEARETSSAR